MTFSNIRIADPVLGILDPETPLPASQLTGLELTVCDEDGELTGQYEGPPP